jgi:hypothetical protein
MEWKCTVCGIENSFTTRRCVGGCGFSFIQARLVLTETESKKQLKMHVTTDVGYLLIKTIAENKSNTVSEFQFKIIKNETLGGWFVCHFPSALNQTLLNGVTILSSDPVPVISGDVLSIGRGSLKLFVTLEDK